MCLWHYWFKRIIVISYWSIDDENVAGDQHAATYCQEGFYSHFSFRFLQFSTRNLARFGSIPCRLFCFAQIRRSRHWIRWLLLFMWSELCFLDFVASLPILCRNSCHGFTFEYSVYVREYSLPTRWINKWRIEWNDLVSIASFSKFTCPRSTEPITVLN